MDTRYGVRPSLIVGSSLSTAAGQPQCTGHNLAPSHSHGGCGLSFLDSDTQTLKYVVHDIGASYPNAPDHPSLGKEAL
ncbi:uncharacterized protein N7500_004003 [Penicillium coprophilum]|uniref:uncharacterized protein n=1 Tax=Penicillium coprophilum TaxID=36646 RepID=UPI00239ABE5C|nr:uncharacterized protein N7500_004003 [Penicillium coprophilum]KAJ5171220.1 hypothetical protein N7500_004003 [Penicillium coprophilum]